jgi:hypothetical protein
MSTSRLQFDAPVVENFFDQVVRVDKYCAEVRLLKARIDFARNKIFQSEQEHSVVAGWFTSGAELVCELNKVSDNLSIYIIVNPIVLEGRPPRAKNTLTYVKKGDFAGDDDVALIRWVILDIDPRSRTSRKHQNSSNGELAACIGCARRIIDDGVGLGIPDLTLYGCSGNGAWVLVRAPDLPNTFETLTAIEYFVRYVSKRYSSDLVDVDLNSRNPSRMLGLPGTTKYKAPKNDPDHPYRRITIEQAESHPPGAV